MSDGWDAPHPDSSAVELGMKQDFLGQGQSLFSSVLNGTYFSNTISERGEREQPSGSPLATPHQDGCLVDSSSSCSSSLHQGGDLLLKSNWKSLCKNGMSHHSSQQNSL